MVVNLRKTSPVSISFFLVFVLVSLEYREEEMGGKNEKFSFKNNQAQTNQRNPTQDIFLLQGQEKERNQ